MADGETSSLSGAGREELSAQEAFASSHAFLAEPTEAEVRVRAREKSREIFVPRVHLGIVAILIAIGLMGLLGFRYDESGARIAPMTYVALTTVPGIILYLLTRRTTPVHVEAFTCIALIALCLLGGMWGTVEDMPAMAYVLLVGLAMGCTALLPWSAWWQLWVALSGLLAVLGNLYWGAGELSLAVAPTILPVVILLLGISVYGTYELERSRWKSARDDLVLTMARRRLTTMNEILEEQVTARTAELERLVEEMQRFSYTVSHDLRAPLRSINAYATILAEEGKEKLGEKETGYLTRLRAAAVDMDAMINAMLVLARVSRTELNWGPIDLSRLGRDIAAELQAAEPERKVDWSIEDGLKVFGDSALLGDALRNLLANAWKFTSNRTMARIELGMNDNGKEPIYCVRDNGAGFDMKHVHHLFQPFTRLHHVDEFEGTGVGLAAVRGIIQRHGGRVWAHGAAGKGAEFFFTLAGEEHDTGNSG